MSDSAPIIEGSRITKYLESHVPRFKGPIKARQFGAGRSNPTFLVETSSGNYVLRCQPLGELLKSAHAVDREYRALDALKHSNVPVPIALHLCLDREVIGSLFYVMSYEEGRIFKGAAMPEIDNSQRGSIYEEAIKVLATIHDLNPETAGLSDYGKPGNYFERQVWRMTKQYKASETEHIQEMEDLIEWLPANMPSDDGQVSLVHGDYHFANIIFHPEKPVILAVLDWELSTLGHPFADLAYFCMGLHMPEDFPIRGLAGKDRQALNIPTEDQIVENYCRKRDIAEISHWVFYVVFSFFRLAAIVQGIKKRAEVGTASHGEEARRFGDMPTQLARMAVKTIELAK